MAFTCHTCGTLLKHCAAAIVKLKHHTAVVLGMQVYERMLADGVAPTGTTYTSLISAYGKAGQVSLLGVELCLQGR